MNLSNKTTKSKKGKSQTKSLYLLTYKEITDYLDSKDKFNDYIVEYSIKHNLTIKEISCYLKSKSISKCIPEYDLINLSNKDLMRKYFIAFPTAKNRKEQYTKLTNKE